MRTILQTVIFLALGTFGAAVWEAAAQTARGAATPLHSVGDVCASRVSL